MTFPGTADRDEARQRVRHLDAGEALDALVLDEHGEVQAQVGDVRERTSGIERQRRQHRHHVVEPGPGGGNLPGIELGMIEDADPGGVQLRQELVRPARAERAREPLRLVADLRELLRRRDPVGGRLRHARGDLLLEAGDADHEELVEVRRDDGEEADALEQRVRRVLRLLENPPLERQQRQLPVHEELRVEWWGLRRELAGDRRRRVGRDARGEPAERRLGRGARGEDRGRSFGTRAMRSDVRDCAVLCR
jgi:hypothetical protein